MKKIIACTVTREGQNNPVVTCKNPILCVHIVSYYYFQGHGHNFVLTLEGGQELPLSYKELSV